MMTNLLPNLNDYLTPTACQCATCETKLPVLSSAARLMDETGGMWFALSYHCPECAESGEDYALVQPKCAELLGSEYTAWLDITRLKDALTRQARIPAPAAEHLAQHLIDSGFTGTEVLAGGGMYGLNTALWCVIYQVGNRWHLAAGYLYYRRHAVQPSWRWVDCFTTQSETSARALFHFEHAPSEFSRVTVNEVG